MKTQHTVPMRTISLLQRALLSVTLMTLLSGCVEGEEAVDELGTNPPASDTPVGGNPPTADPDPMDPPAMDPPAMDPPAMDPPAMDPPAMDPPAMDPPPADPAPMDPPPMEPDDPMNPPPPDQPPPSDDMPPPVDPDPPMEPMPLTDVQRFEQTLYPVLRKPENFCAGCHGAIQIPLFAVDAIEDAYNAVVSQQKVDLVNPTGSRIYLRAAVDRHNCGGVDSCDRIAAEFLTAINEWAMLAEPEAPPPVTAAVSGTVSFADAMDVALPRADENAIAKFAFAEGSGTTTTDSVSGITLSLDGMEWLPEGGLKNVTGKAQASAEDSRRVFDAINATRAYSVEVWIRPDNVAQDGPARIVSLSQDTGTRNFTLGQNAIYYQLRNRSANTGGNGTPALEALNSMVTTELTHLVTTFDEASGRKLYVNGELVAAEEQADTLDWLDNQTFVLGNEVTNDRLWQGVFELVAVHNDALTAQAIQQNFEAGLGNLTTLRFDITEAVGTPAMIELIAAPLDGNGYLFAKPRYLGEATGVAVRNMRIAVNGSVPVAAQAFRRIDVMVEENGWELSPLGAVIPQGMGPEMDQFELRFEVLGAATGTAEPIAPATPLPPLPDSEDQLYGVRSFSQLNDTFAALTGLDSSGGALPELFEELRGALPPTNDLESYSQAQQIAVQRLANGYCGRLTDNVGRCSDFFGQCAVDAGAQDSVANLLYDRFIGDGFADQPDRVLATGEIVSLLNDLNCSGGCTGADARIALAAACSATLSSGAVTLH